MKTLEKKPAGQVPWPMAAGVTVALILGMVYLRLALYPHRIVPLTYALPLLAGLWHRHRVLLWTMAVCFMLLSAVKILWLLPGGYFDDRLQPFLFMTMQWLNILVPAGVVHLVLNYHQRQVESNEALARANAELETSNEELESGNEELAAREEEISRQNEELQTQTEELEQQTEELQSLNEELAARESTLQLLLQLAGPTTGESQLLDELCAAVPRLLGADVMAAAVLERQNGQLTLCAHSELGPEEAGRTLPLSATLAAMAMERMQIAQLDDARLRPDLRFPRLRSGRVPGAVIAAPLSLGGQATGALEAYAAGTRHWTAHEAQLLEWLAGQCSRAWENIRLRDERTRAEAALRTSESQLQSIVENLVEGLVVSDLEGRLLHWNPVAREIHGFVSLEECQRRLAEFVDIFQLSAMDGSILPLDQWPLARVLRGEHLRDLEVHIRRVSSDWQRVFSYGGTLVRDADGQPLIAVITVNDITERKRAERALRESEQQYRVVAEFTYDWEFWLRPDGRYHYVSPSVERITGRCVTPETLATDFLRLTVHPDDLDWRLEHMRQELAGEGPCETEYRIVRPDGEVRWIHHCSQPIRDGAGQFLGIRGSNRDTTERKRAEESLQRTANDLARSNKDLEQFAYVASHDLQEPLRMVAGYLQLLSERYLGRLDEKADKFIGYAVDGAERMSGLIHDLLDYSRVNTRAEQFRDTCAEKTLDSALRNLRAAIEESGAAISHDPLPVVRADETQLAQLFQNLVGNAVKFRSPHRTAQIHISARQERREWLFTVQDNGIGFDEKYQDKMFLIFQRLHSRGKYPGTGIGLAICKRIVERHGGTIWARAEPGEGATFCFTIPTQGNS
ncbi:MAG: PAS domain S-box protein [Pirellulaceae bacterium]